MRILLVGNYEPDAQRSMLAYAEALAAGLAGQGVDARLLSAPPRLLGKRSPSRGLGKWLGYLDKFVLFLPRLRRAARDVDLVHICDQGNGMLVRPLRGFRHVITCHDVIAIRAARGDVAGVSVGPTGRLFQRLNLRGLQCAEDVVCVSESTCRELQELAPHPAGRTHLIRNGLLERYPAMDREKADAILASHGIPSGERFLFHIGNNAAYKNRPGTVRIFGQLKRLGVDPGLKLVLAGKAPDPGLLSVIRESGVADSIVVLVDIDVETKVALYRRATALLFPSLSEGFGLPIIEAQTLGCPVITTNRGPMNEVAGSAAVFLDPSDEAEAARAIEEALPHLGDRIAAGLENAALYTEAGMIEAYIDLYRRLLARR